MKRPETAESACAVPDCSRPRRSRGWCNAHYLRFRQYGDPTGGGPLVTHWGGAPCQAPGCDRPIRCKGLCASHYSMQLTYGRITAITAEDRFWSKVQEDRSGCWLWTGAIGTGGYGNFYYESRPGGSASAPHVRAHRFAYESMRGEIPEGLFLDHMCRTRACVNPWHLEPVSPDENARRRWISVGLTGTASIRMIDEYYAIRARILDETGDAA